MDIENQRGTTRAGVDSSGKSWKSTFAHDYGDIQGTVGADSDPVDVFVGDVPDAENVYVVNQVNPDGSFDEHKLMVGFGSSDEAVSAYLANYEAGWTGLGSIVTLPLPSLMAWLHTGDLTQPAPAEGYIAKQGAVSTTAVFTADAGAFSFEDAVLTLVQTEDAVAGGPLRLLASPARVRNENTRYFEPDFLRAAAKQGDDWCKATPRYGEEPHPPFDSSRGQYLTDSSNEVWRQDGWATDAGGNLISLNTPDPRTAKGRRVKQKTDDKEKIGGSVRWWADRTAPVRSLTDGTQIQHFGEEMIGHCFPMVFDHVPNPAFVQAGRVMDAGQMIAMTDATNLSALPQGEVTDAEEAAPAAAPSTTEAVKSEPVASGNSAKKPIYTKPNFAKTTQEKKPLKTAEQLRAQAQTIEDPDAKQSILDAADALDAQPTVDAILDRVRTELAPGINKANAYVDAQTQRDAAAAETAKVVAFADAVEAGTAPEVARFTQAEVRQKFARKVRGKATEAEARVVLLDAIETQDEIQSSLDLAMKGMKQGGSHQGDGQARGNASGDGSERVEVVVDDKDKKADAFLDAVSAATNRSFETYFGRPLDPLLHKAVEGKVNSIMGPIERRVGRKAVVDSIEYLTTPAGKKLNDDFNSARQGMTDAGLIDASVQVTDAVMTTTNILQQPVLLQLVLRPMYQNMTALKYMGAFGPEAAYRNNAGGDNGAGFDGGPAGGNLGRTFKFQSRYLEPPVQSTAGLTRTSGRIAENAGIPRSQIVGSWQNFFTYRRALAFGMTKELINWTATGAAPFDLLGDNIAQNISLYARETDSLCYYEMVSVTLEQNCRSVTAPETVAAGNLTAGGTQDGVSYNTPGATGTVLFVSPDNPYPPQDVVFIAQPDCGGPVAAQKTPAAAGRLADAGFMPSVSNACRTPLVPPRDKVTLDNYNNETIATLYPIAVKLGNTVLTPGYLTADRRIGSSYDPSTGTVTQAQYAVDFVTGKFVFSAASGVTASSPNLTLIYSYATNFAQLQVKFGQAGYPGGQTARAYADNIFSGNNAIRSSMGSYPNFTQPEYCISSLNAAAYLVQSDIFDKLRSPTGTNLINPTADTYAEYAGLMYDQINAPTILGDNTLLLIKNGMSKYVVETPLHTEGGFTGYDAQGQLVARTEYMMNQFETICTPLAQDRNGFVFNQQSRLVCLF